MSDFRQKFARRLSKLLEKPKPETTGKTITKKKREEMVKPMSIAFPLYIYPSTGTWSPLFNAIHSNPSTSFNIVVNPNNGPGGPVPDANYITYLSQLNSHDNVNLFGYIYTSWGARNLSDIESEIATYETWGKYANADIHVDGVFLDEAPSDTKFVGYIADITRLTKSTLSNKAQVWSNPGVPVDPSFYAVVDLVNACENSWDYWSKHGGNASIPSALRSKSTVMIHSYTGDSALLEGDADALADAGYHSSLITTDQSYTTFCPLWGQYVDYVATSDITSGANTNDPCA